MDRARLKIALNGVIEEAQSILTGIENAENDEWLVESFDYLKVDYKEVKEIVKEAKK